MKLNKKQPRLSRLAVACCFALVSLGVHADELETYGTTENIPEPSTDVQTLEAVAEPLAENAAAVDPECSDPNTFYLTCKDGFKPSEWEVRFDNKLSFGASVRLESQDPDLVGIANGGRAFSTNNDDGNLNYDRGDLINTTAKITSHLSIQHGNFGLNARGSYIYDPRLVNQNFFDDADYAGAAGMPPRTKTPAQLAAKRDRVQNNLGNDLNLLEGYLFANPTIADHDFSFRLGAQVLNWGESTFVLNGLNSLVAIDASRARVPGFELEEAFIPQNMLWASTSLGQYVNLEAFWQLGLRPTQPDTVGSFYSTNDFAAFGGDVAEVGFGRCQEHTAPFTGNPACPTGTSIPRRPDNKPNDARQGGANVHITIPQLNDLDLGLYAATYHSRLPLFSGVAANNAGVASSAGYFVEYPRGINMFGASFNTSIPFGIAMQGEFSYKPNQPLQIDDVELLLAGLRIFSSTQFGSFGANDYIRGFRRHEVSTSDISFTKIFGPISWLRSDQMTLLGEIGMVHVHDLPSNQTLRYDAPATYTPGNATQAGAFGVPQQAGDTYATATSWGYKLLARTTWDNWLNLPVSLQSTVRFDHDVKGRTPTPLLNFVENRKQVGVGLEWIYKKATSFGLDYTLYYGGGVHNLLSDRDILSANVKYSF